MNRGVRIQVKAVQKTIKYRVILTLPIAFKRFVNGLVTDPKTVFNEKKASDIIAGSHFKYLGINSMNEEESVINPAAIGKIKSEIMKIDFSITILRAL